MKGLVAVPCPDCYTEILTFSLAVNDEGTFTLTAPCAKCKLNIELVVTHDDLRDLADGKGVYFRANEGEKKLTAREPKYLM